MLLPRLFGSEAQAAGGSERVLTQRQEISGISSSKKCLYDGPSHGSLIRLEREMLFDYLLYDVGKKIVQIFFSLGVFFCCCFVFFLF